MRRLLAALIAATSLSLTSFAAQEKQVVKTIDLNISCSEIPSLREAAAFQKDAQIARAIRVETPREETLMRLHMALGLERLLRYPDTIECVES